MRGRELWLYELAPSWVGDHLGPPQNVVRRYLLSSGVTFIVALTRRWSRRRGRSQTRLVRDQHSFRGTCFTLTILATNPALYPSPHVPEF